MEEKNPAPQGSRGAHDKEAPEHPTGIIGSEADYRRVVYIDTSLRATCPYKTCNGDTFCRQCTEEYLKGRGVD